MEFTVGDKPIKNFRMIERHYFRNRVLKEFDFDFGFCMPNSRNTCEHIYEMPELSEEESKFAILTTLYLIEPTFGSTTPYRMHLCHLFLINAHISLTLFAVQQLIDNPYETKSDSFYFVEDKLIMHNKADYAYNARTAKHSQ